MWSPSQVLATNCCVCNVFECVHYFVGLYHAHLGTEATILFSSCRRGHNKPQQIRVMPYVLLYVQKLVGLRGYNLRNTAECVANKGAMKQSLYI